MAKQRILIVDHDDQTLHSLAAALRRADFLVTCNPDPHAALEKMRQQPPDALVLAVQLPYLDGFEVCRRMKQDPDLEWVPVIFVTGEASMEEKATTLQLGAADYLQKPLDPAAFIARLHGVFKRQVGHPLTAQPPVPEFTGELRDLDVAALSHMMHAGQKSGTLMVQREAAHAFVYFLAGQIIDAEVAHLYGAAALYQVLRWDVGTFSLTFGVPDRPPALTAPTEELLLEGMRRFDEWSRWLARLPPLETVLHRQAPSASDAPLLRLVDGQRTLLHVFEATDMGDVECAAALVEHWEAGRIAAVPPVFHAAPPPVGEGSMAAAVTSKSGAGAHDAAHPTSALFFGSTPGRGVERPPLGAPDTLTPRSPEEAFGLGPAPEVDQSYLNAPLPARWYRRPSWLLGLGVGALVLSGVIWGAITQR